MWREEVGITEMMLAYIGEFVQFDNWSTCRSVVVEILSCHEQMRHKKMKPSSINYTNHAELEYKSEDTENEKGETEMITNVSENENGYGKVEYFANKWECDSVPTKDPNSSSHDHDPLTFMDDGDPEMVDELKEVVPFVIEQSSRTIPVSSDSYQSVDPYVGGNVDKQLPPDQDEDDDVTYLKTDSSIGEAISIPSATMESNRRLFNEQNRRVSGYTKQYFCSFCGRAFKQLSHKVVHERRHTGEKPFTCRFCSRAFTHRSSKDRHERIHTGERPYPCRFCSKSFIEHSRRTDHEKTHFIASQVSLSAKELNR